MLDFGGCTRYVCSKVRRVVVIRARLWLRCAAVHDPVSPILVQPAIVGWEAKNRRVDLTIERPFTGEELLKRMKGWVTTNPAEVIDVVKQFGRLKVLDDRELVVEFETEESFQSLQQNLSEKFRGEVDVEMMSHG
jgi:hypothetical protein